ncbi:MAG: hypothetical protein ACXVIY_13540 [Mucilaginibacter sp.]
MSRLDYAYSYLKVVEKKHRLYFSTNHLDIMDCLRLKGTDLVTDRPTMEHLPADIRYEIETLFQSV